MFNDDELRAERELSAKKNARKVLLICFVAATPIAIFLIFHSMKAGVISGHGFVALVLAVVFTLVGTIGFMSVTFFSSRSGVDDQPNYREIVEKQREREKEG